MERRRFLKGAMSGIFFSKFFGEMAYSQSPEVPLPHLAGLTAAQQDRASRLHQESIVIDVHDHNGKRQDYVDMMKGGVNAKIYKPFGDGIFFDEQNRRVFPLERIDWTGKYLEKVAKVEALEKSGQPPILIIRKLEDIYRAKREGKAGVILGNEGSLPLGESLKTFEELYQRGLRELALFWPAGKGPNDARHVLNEQRKLTPFAHQVIEKANQWGVVLDSSHLADTPAFLQVVQESKFPVIHTHGQAKYPRTRELKEGDLEDDQIRAIANKGGVMGVQFCSWIKNLNGWNWAPTLEDLLDHMQYLVKVGGIDCVGIGADYFPWNSKPIGKPFYQVGNTLIEDRAWDQMFVVGLKNISAMPLVTQGLVRRGLSDGEIKKILGLNVLRVLKEVWKA